MQSGKFTYTSRAFQRFIRSGFWGSVPMIRHGRGPTVFAVPWFEKIVSL
ncbi:MAG: hypothetical protein HRT83_00025 [Hyphomicrobiaceae bacterium]|nr:hypothetical protein [Hyphomicrobiaceae bacterium]